MIKIKLIRNILWPMREKVTGEWRILHKEELYALYCSPNIIQVTKSRRMRWVRNVARMAERRCAYRVCSVGVRE